MRALNRVRASALAAAVAPAYTAEMPSDALAEAIPAAIPRAALVTGGAKRLGRAICLALAEAGFDVALHYGSSAADAEQTAEAIRSSGRRAAVLSADLAREEEVVALLPAAAAALEGPIGVLVNNASVFERDEWSDATRGSWDRHLEPNLRAPFVLTQQLARALPAGADGVVVNMLDQRVWSPTPHFLSYTLSKTGLWSLTQQLALALAPRRIRVNGIGPGPALPSPRQSAEQFARQSASVPLGHGTSPDEVARAVLAILALPAMTGQMIALDGGQHLQWSPASAAMGALPE
jgi:NAD(P)-dependent dehydrogenase (short-subunit alcohol dehydrogenase family)